jgi:hypothetical protein
MTAFGQTRHWSRHRRRTAFDPKLTWTGSRIPERNSALCVAWTRVTVALPPRERSLSIAPIGNIGPFAAGRDCSRIQPALAKLQRAQRMSSHRDQ